MYKIIILLFMLPMLCSCEEQKPVPVAEEKFDSSINKVVFSHKQSGRHNFSSDIVVTKTEIGALVKWDSYSKAEFDRGSNKFWKAEFSAKEWQDFIKALYNIHFNEWQKEYKGTRGQFRIEWNVDIFSPNEKEAGTFSGENGYPPNWNEFTKIMEDVTKKIITKTKKEAELPLENKLKMEYEKRFGEPISEFELSTKRIAFRISKEKEYYHYIPISRTETGAILKDGINYSSFINRGIPFELELSSGEWLDFIRALHKSKVEEWEEKYESNTKKSPAEEWMLEVCSSNKYGCDKFSGKSKYPPNWKQLKKTMDGMIARIGKIREEAENKLKAEYQKKFGSPISDFELSVRSIRIRNLRGYDLTIFRTATGAVAEETEGWGKMELSSEEWLNFVRTLHKHIKNWGKNYNSTGYAGDRWNIEMFSLGRDMSNATDDENAELVFGGNTYPPNWDELGKIAADIKKRIIKAPYVEIEKKLETEYQKKFGEPISEFELSIESVKFDTYGVTSVSRTKTGAEASYFLARTDHETIDLELTTEEWLDFIRILRKCQIYEWKDKYGEYSRNKNRWYLKIHLIGYENKTSEGYYDISPPNWNEFKKTMDNVLARIKAEPARKKAEEAKLRAK